MPVTLAQIGIQSVDITLAESVEVSAKVEAKPLLDKNGRFADGAAFDPTSDFSLKGRGDLPAGLAVGTDGGSNVDGLFAGGVTIISSVKEMEKNDDWNAWECSGQNFPNAA
jgi:hypothetical protein